MSQTRLQSLVETVSGTAVAFAISIITGMIVYPIYGHTFKVADLGAITFWFTLVSLVRSYIWRRFFNWLHRWQAIRKLQADLTAIEAECPDDTCMCGAPMDHSPWDDGHTPLSMRDFYSAEVRQKILRLKGKP